MKKSMLDVAYDILVASDKSLAFGDILNQVAKTLEMSEEDVRSKMSQFYTNLSIDGRFVCCTDNHWEVRERVPFEQVHIDMNDAYNEKDEAADDVLEDDIEKELGEEGISIKAKNNTIDAEIEEVTDSGEAE